MSYRQDNAASVRGLVLRVTRLASDGTPRVGGADNCDAYIKSGFVNFTFTPTYNESDEISIQNAAGQLCVYYKAPDTLQSVEFGLELCDPDPLLTEMLVGGEALLAAAAGGNIDVIGYAAPKIGESADQDGVAVEVWTTAVVNGKSANTFPYWHYLFPYATFKFDGERVIENGNLATVFAGVGSGNSGFGAGPMLDTAGISPAVTGDTFAWQFPTVTERPFAYARTAFAPVGLDGCFEVTGTATLDASTSAIAGIPGSFNGAPAANIAAMTTIVATPTTAWADGQHVVLANATTAYWKGTAWAAGMAP